MSSREWQPEHLAGLVHGVAMTINGRSVGGADGFDVVNPATERVLGQAPECSQEQVDAAMIAAASAFHTWSRDDRARVAAMHAAADRLESAATELALLLTAEQGKPLSGALAEVATSALWLRHFADLDMDAATVVEDSAARTVSVYRRPLGVAVAITPWNYPLQMAFKKAAQALRPGNTLVIKPSPYTPLATLKAVQLLQDVFPPGVLSAVSGSGAELGTWLTVHRLTRKITFTGSTATGKLVAASAVPDLKRSTLELGGNDPAIVLDDADVDLVVAGLFDRAFLNCGQVCAAIKRAYVPEALHAQVVEGLAARARQVVVGDGMDPATECGPLNNRVQLDIVSELVRDALSNGATAAAGGSDWANGPGYFYRPTILTDVVDGMRIVDEEQFGPVLPVLSYSDLGDAISRANNSPFGLGGSVWTSDPQRGIEVARQLDVGNAWINTHAVTTPTAPFAGAKWSGIGVENGLWGLHEFTQIQSVNHQH